jgi:hypothetical protein
MAILPKGAQWDEDPQMNTFAVTLYGWEEDGGGWFIPVTDAPTLVETVDGFVASSDETTGTTVQTRYVSGTNTIQLR